MIIQKLRKFWPNSQDTLRDGTNKVCLWIKTPLSQMIQTANHIEKFALGGDLRIKHFLNFGIAKIGLAHHFFEGKKLGKVIKSTGKS